MPFIPDKPSGFIPDSQTSSDPSGYLMRLSQYVKNPQGPIEPALAAAGDVYNAMAAPVKSLGQFANKGNQLLASALQSSSMPPPVQMAGRIYGAVAPYLNPIPTSNLGMATLPFTAAEGLGALSNRFGGAMQAATVGSQPLKQAVLAQKAVANALSAANRVKPNQLAAVIANPEIMSDAIPSTAKVSQMYEDAFNQAGMKIDDARYKFLTGLSRPLRDQQIGKAEEILDMAFDPNNPAKLKDGLADTQLFVSRTAAAKLAQSTASATNPAYKSAVLKQQDLLDDALENSSLPQIRQLSRLWFMAKTKEAMLEPLPLNKAGTPNALSSLLMMAQFKRAAEQLGEGSPIKAAINAGTGAMMSPYIGGQAIRSGQFVGNNPGALSQILGNVINPNGQ